MLWLFTAILSYFFLSLTSLADRYLLSGPLKPKFFAFIVSLLGLAALVFVPFGFYFPSTAKIALSLFAGIIWLLATLALYYSIVRSEISVAVPAIGGFIPIFTFIITFLFSPKKIVVGPFYLIALALLTFGGVLISLKKNRKIEFKSLIVFALSAFLYSLSFFLSKLAYLGDSFVPIFVFIRLGTALPAPFFLFSKEIRKDIFLIKKRGQTKKKISFAFLLGQFCGAVGGVLQNYSVALAQINQVPLINALEGTRYVFLLFFAALLNKQNPDLFREEFSPTVLKRKIAAILIIGLGFFLLIIR